MPRRNRSKCRVCGAFSKFGTRIVSPHRVTHHYGVRAAEVGKVLPVDSFICFRHVNARGVLMGLRPEDSGHGPDLFSSPAPARPADDIRRRPGDGV